MKSIEIAGLVVPLFLLLLSVPSVEAGKADERSVSHASRTGTNLVWLTIYESDMEAVPRWEPSENLPPPLSLQDAVNLAADRLAADLPGAAGYFVHGVGVTRYKDTDRWYYRVWFSNSSKRVFKEQNRSMSLVAVGNVQILVLMSGRTIFESEDGGEGLDRLSAQTGEFDLLIHCANEKKLAGADRESGSGTENAARVTPRF